LKEKYGVDGFYTSSLFDFSSVFKDEYLEHSIELGRSFVQSNYWNSNALNYLWQGIGALLADNPHIKYMFGPVSISNNYPGVSKKIIAFFYNKWFGSVNNLASSKNRFIIPQKDITEFQSILTGENYKKDYLFLKAELKSYGFTVPVLYKHYSELCNHGGVRFLDFGIDEDFENCVDGLILVDVDKITDSKKKRYIECFFKQESKIL
jgi:hypothetical protein